MNVYEWATFYAEAGMRVFPVIDKRPFPGTIQHNGKEYTWPKYASTDPHDIKFVLDLAYSKSKKRTVELAWAIDEKHVVIDIDRADKFEQFLTTHQLPLPTTLTQLSPRAGGKHFVYTVNQAYRNQAFNDTTESDPKQKRIFDVKTRGGYIVLATEQTARRWQAWIPPTPLPEQWLSLLRPFSSVDISMIDWDASEYWSSLSPSEQKVLKQRIDAAKKDIDTRAPAISGQNGSSQTFKVAVILVKKHELPPCIALLTLRDAYNPRCQPPWKEKDLRQKIARVCAITDWDVEDPEETKIYERFLELYQEDYLLKKLNEDY